jgi:predicted DNA-binding transcriptional regulator YafY
LSELTGPIRKRLKELLESGEHSADDIARRIRILAIGSRKVEPAHFRTLSTALLSRRRLRIRHQRRQDGDVLEREVSAQRLVHYRDNWYLDAWCHTREALRTFGVDAIESVTVVDEPAKDVDDATLERHFASGYGIFSGVETQEAELLFDANRARWVAHETWHPQQTGQLQPDGRYRLRFPYAREPELVMDVLRYGAGVEVISPPTLRASVAKELHAAASRYGKG